MDWHAFEEFRTFSLREFGLDPVGYLGLPGLGWDGLLLLMKKRGLPPLDTLQDPGMYRFFEKAIRGGNSFVGMRHNVANHPDVEGYDSTQKIRQDIDLDANNLYGHSMVQKLPHSNFEWVHDPETLQWLASRSTQFWEEFETGATLEVDLHYPKELHDLHNDFPLAPEKMKVNESQVSNYCTSWLSDKGKKFTSSEKLVAHLGDRHKYIIHAKTLALYQKLGMKVTKIHRAVTYHQCAWMAPWIEGNTARRALAQTTFEQDLFKLANNACFGKTMENVRGRMDVRLITADDNDHKAYTKLVAKPTYCHDWTIGENDNSQLLGVQMLKRVVTLDKPIYAGATILDYSKDHMYHCHYNIFQPIFGAENLRVGGTDTDSIMYTITCDNLDERIWKNRQHFDLSNYPKDHPLFCEDNKKQMGKFKNELAKTGVISERINLRSKLYAFKLAQSNESALQCKGVKRTVVEKTLKLDHYREVLQTQTSISREQV